MKKNNIIDEWLDKHGDPEIHKRVEQKLMELSKEAQKQHLIDMMQEDEESGLYDEPKEETLEEFAKNHLVNNTKGFAFGYGSKFWYFAIDLIKTGAKWQMDKQDNFIMGFLEFIEGTYSYSNIFDYWYLHADTSKTYTKKELLKKYIDTLNGN
jgi:hypothetical protein